MGVVRMRKFLAQRILVSAYRRGMNMMRNNVQPAIIADFLAHETARAERLLS